MFSSFDSHAVSKGFRSRSRIGIDYLPDGTVVERTLPGIDAQVSYLEAQEARNPVYPVDAGTACIFQKYVLNFGTA
jgi:hypothetical protein